MRRFQRPNDLSQGAASELMRKLLRSGGTAVVSPALIRSRIRSALFWPTVRIADRTNARRTAVLALARGNQIARARQQHAVQRTTAAEPIHRVVVV